ncbi:MAG: HEAT repeat domain-containing protein [Planctomycetaceae bacterium]
MACSGCFVSFRLSRRLRKMLGLLMVLAALPASSMTRSAADEVTPKAAQPVKQAVPVVKVVPPRVVPGVQAVAVDAAIEVVEVAVEAKEAELELAKIKKKQAANGRRPGTSTAAEPAEGTTTDSPETKKPDAETPDILLDRLEVIHKEIARMQGLPAPARPTKGVVLMVDNSHSGVASYYSNDPTRYVVTRLWVINLDDAECEVRPLEIEMIANGQRLSGKERHPSIQNESVPFNDSQQSLSNLKTEELLKVPAGGCASTWVVISKVPLGPFVPTMTLEVPIGDQKQSFDLSTFERARIALSTERIGPKSALALITIQGEMNTISIGRMTDEVESLSGQGVSRIVIHATDAAPKMSSYMINWFTQSRAMNQNNRQFSQMPGLSNSVRELHVTGFKGVPNPLQGMTSHDSAIEAVAAALRTAYEVLPPQQVLTAIRTGDVRTRAAALEHGSRQLPEEAVPYLISLTRDEDPTIRRSAIAALVNFGSPEVVNHLVQIAVEEPEPYSSTALRSLAGSRFPVAHDALTQLLTQKTKVSQTRLISVLGEYPRPQWADTVYEFTKSPDNALRQTATVTLIRIGHPRLVEVLSESLRSDQSSLNNIAFNHLASRTDRESEELAIEYALKQLEKSPPTGITQQLIQRTRDQRFIPPLQKQLDNDNNDRTNVIQLLMQIGDDEVARDLVARFPKLKDNEKSSVLGQMQSVQPDLAVKLARMSLASSNHSVLNQSCNILAIYDGSNETVELFRALLAKGDKNNAHTSTICNALGMIGSDAAKKVLLELKKSEDSNTRNYATNGLNNMRNLQPAFNYLNMANYYLKQGNDLKNAETHLKYALKMDPEMPEAWAMRSQLRLRQNKPDEAISDAKKSIELDPEPAEPYSSLGQAYFQKEKYTDAIPPLRKAIDKNTTEHLVVTTLALALVMTDEVDEGLKIAIKDQAKNKDNNVYNYNVGCVFARAAERRKPIEPNPKNPDGKDPKVAEWRGKAIKFVEKAVEQGFTDYKHIQNDPDLKSLHDDPAFRKLSKLDEPQEEDPIPGTDPAEKDAAAEMDAAAAEEEAPIEKANGPAPRQRAAPAVPILQRQVIIQAEVIELK